MSDLRERIAALLIAHPDLMSGKCCGAMEFDHQDQWASHLADVLIHELVAIPDRVHTDEYGNRWEWCGGQPETWAWRITALGGGVK